MQGSPVTTCVWIGHVPPPLSNPGDRSIPPPISPVHHSHHSSQQNIFIFKLMLTPPSLSPILTINSHNSYDHIIIHQIWDEKLESKPSTIRINCPKIPHWLFWQALFQIQSSNQVPIEVLSPLSFWTLAVTKIYYDPHLQANDLLLQANDLLLIFQTIKGSVCLSKFSILGLDLIDYESSSIFLNPEINCSSLPAPSLASLSLSCAIVQY